MLEVFLRKLTKRYNSATLLRCSWGWGASVLVLANVCVLRFSSTDGAMC